MKKILLLSMGAGAGHGRAAQALAAFAAIHPAGVQATHLDLLDFVAEDVRRFFTEHSQKLMAHYPELSAHLYRTTDGAPRHTFRQKLLRALERLRCRAFLAEVHRQRPDAIVCTHYKPAELLWGERRKRKLAPPIWQQITDFDLHSNSVVPFVRGYFVASEEVACDALKRGIAPDAVFITGIPVMPAFGLPLARRDCAAQFGLDPARKIVLLMSGGIGTRRLDLLAERLLAMPADFQLVALAGRNQAMLEALQSLALQHPGRLFAQGYTDRIERLMACADLAVTKPGGLTTAECLAMGLPMVVHTPLPGHEERNADFLLEHGAALKAIDDDAVAYRVDSLLAAPQRLADMRQKSVALGKPQAARHVLDRVLGLAASGLQAA